MSDWVRRGLVAFFTVVRRVFFHRVDVAGLHRLPKGGTILVGNHPNSLIDPVLIVTTCGRPLSFAAKDVLFNKPLLGPIIKAGGGVPLRRRQDHEGEQAGTNDQAFEAFHTVLAAGGTFGIFPEGISHRGPELAPLKTGAARIALSAAAAGIEVAVVPVGLTYFDRDRMRSSVAIRYGEPLAIDANLLELHRSDPRAAAHALTAEIDEAMRDVTTNVPDFQTAQALGTLRSLVADADQKGVPGERAALQRRIVALWESRKETPAMKGLLERLRHYQYCLDAFGIRDDLLRGDLCRRAAMLALGRHLFLLGILVPLSLPGFLVHVPILAAGMFAGRTLSPRPDVIATTKMGVTTLLTMIVYSVVVGTILWGTPFPVNLGWAAYALVLLMASGWALVRVLERQSMVRQGMRTTRLLWRYRDQFSFLQEEREALRREFAELL
jgi:1-acyl-sn-glycerol-3-phosphate acyltransferase